MRKVIAKTAPWMLVNVLGVAGYLYFASWLWAPPGQQGEFGGPGDPLIYMSSAFPILAACFLLNLVWIVYIVRLAKRSWTWSIIVVWLVVVVAWYGVKKIRRFARL
jgi:hypothetical protein